MENIGIVDLDNLQKNLSQIESSIKEDCGLSVGSVNIKKLELDKIKKIPDKSSLTLFDKYYVNEKT